MKILVTVKSVIDANVKIRVKADNTGVETKQVKMSINPFDEIALEQAIRFKENNLADEIIVLSIGSTSAQEVLRHALALGATRAVLIKQESPLCSLSIAKILAFMVKDLKIDLVLMGKQSIDGDNNQTPQMLAGLLDWPQATFASEMLLKEDKTLEVTREIDGGLETLRLHLPAVVSADLRLNQPRYASLPNIMKAKQKPLDIVEIDKEILPASEPVQVLSIKAPKLRVGGAKLDSVKALVDKLQYEDQVL